MIKYAINDRIKPLPMLMYGLQWLLITIPIILIISTIIGVYQFEHPREQIFYTQKLFGLMGGGLIVQILWGHRLPVVIGPAAVLLIGILSTQASQLPEVYTSILIGGALLTLISISKYLRKIQQIFTTRIVITILALIGFTLIPSIIKLIFGGPEEPIQMLCMSIILTFSIVGANRFLKGIWKSTVVFWALILGTGVYSILYGLPEIKMPPFPPGKLSLFIPDIKFDSGILISFLFCYIALFINEIGSIQAIGKALSADNVESSVVRGFRITGLLNIVSGCMGIVGPVDFSLSPGVIMATGCASRYALLPAGIGLILCAFSPRVVYLFSLIPPPVTGIVLIYLMTSQLAAACEMGRTEKALKNFEDCVIVSLPIITALIVAFMPHNAIARIPLFLRPILGNGFVMGVFSVLILEHIVFRKKKR